MAQADFRKPDALSSKSSIIQAPAPTSTPATSIEAWRHWELKLFLMLSAHFQYVLQAPTLAASAEAWWQAGEVDSRCDSFRCSCMCIYVSTACRYMHANFAPWPNGISRINIYAVIVLLVTDQCLLSFCNKLCWGLVVWFGKVSASSVSAIGGTRVESSDSKMHMYWTWWWNK